MKQILFNCTVLTAIMEAFIKVFIFISIWLYISQMFLQKNILDCNANDIIISLLSPILLVGLVSLFAIFNLGDIYMWNTVFDTIENGEDLDFLQMFWLLSE